MMTLRTSKWKNDDVKSWNLNRNMTRMHYLDDFCLFVLFNPWFQEKPCFDLNECNHLYVASVFIGSSLFFSWSECLMYFKGTVHPIIGCIFLCVFLCVNLISHVYGWSICLLQVFFFFSLSVQIVSFQSLFK